MMLTARPDYVFVDEHNRHKRLKGEAVSRAMRTSSDCLTRVSDESL